VQLKRRTGARAAGPLLGSKKLVSIFVADNPKEHETVIGRCRLARNDRSTQLKGRVRGDIYAPAVVPKRLYKASTGHK
jgi:hypothetical protein